MECQHHAVTRDFGRQAVSAMHVTMSNPSLPFACQNHGVMPCIGTVSMLSLAQRRMPLPQLAHSPVSITSSLVISVSMLSQLCILPCQLNSPTRPLARQQRCYHPHLACAPVSIMSFILLPLSAEHASIPMQLVQTAFPTRPFHGSASCRNSNPQLQRCNSNILR